MSNSSIVNIKSIRNKFNNSSYFSNDVYTYLENEDYTLYLTKSAYAKLYSDGISIDDDNYIIIIKPNYIKIYKLNNGIQSVNLLMVENCNQSVCLHTIYFKNHDSFCDAYNQINSLLFDV